MVLTPIFIVFLNEGNVESIKDTSGTEGNQERILLCVTTCLRGLQAGKAVHGPAHVGALVLYIVILERAKMPEYLFVVRVRGVFFKPAKQSIPVIRKVPVPVVRT